jgi:hypothetical protein
MSKLDEEGGEGWNHGNNFILVFNGSKVFNDTFEISSFYND